MVNVPKFHSLDIIFINVSYPYFYLLISSLFTRMLTYSKLKYIINYCSSSSLSLSFGSLDSILISNFHYYFQDGRPTRYYNHRYYKPYYIYDYNRRTWQDHRHYIYRRKAI